MESETTPTPAPPIPPVTTEPVIVLTTLSTNDAAVETPDVSSDRTSAEWWTRPAARWVALLGVTALVGYLCWLMLQPFMDVVIWAVVLVVVFFPVHRRLLVRLQSPNLAAALSCLLVIATILLPLALVTAVVVRDVAHVTHYLQENKQALLNPAPQSLPGRALQWAGQYVDVEDLRSGEWVAAKATEMSGVIAQRTLNVVGGAVGVVVQIFFVIFTMFYLFRDGPRLRNALRGLVPLETWQTHEVFQRTREVIQASVYGSVVIAAVQGTLGGVAFLALGVPSPFLWGVIMILLCLIPMLGAFVVWVPAAIYLAAVGKYWQAIALVLWGTLVIGTIDNVLRPRLVGGRTRLHELVVFFAVLGGLQVFGVLGIVTGPAIAAIAVALFEVWKRARKAPAGDAAGDAIESADDPEAELNAD